MAVELSASIAGLIGLAGLFVQSASSLYVFCRNVPKVREEIEAVADEAKTLKETLQTLEQLLARTDAQPLSGSRAMIALEAEVKSCAECLEGWLRCMEALLPQPGKKLKHVISVLKSAADSNRFLEMRTKLSSRRGQLSILMELLGLELGFRFQNHITEVNEGLSELSQQQSSDFAQTASKLDSLGHDIARVSLSQTESRNTSDDILRSGTQIKQKLDNLEQMQRDFRGATLLQVERMDSYLGTIQKTIIESLKISRAGQGQLLSAQIAKSSRKKLERRYIKRSVAKGSTSSPTVSAQIADESIVSSYTVRLVDTAIRVRYVNGKAKPILIPLSDNIFEEATEATKLDMIRQLQALRLLIWLLREPDHLQIHGMTSQQRTSTRPSILVLNAWLAKFWAIWDHRHWPAVAPPDGRLYREPLNSIKNGPTIVRLSYEHMLKQELALCRYRGQPDASIGPAVMRQTSVVMECYLLFDTIKSNLGIAKRFPSMTERISQSANQILQTAHERTQIIIQSLESPLKTSDHLLNPDEADNLMRELQMSHDYRQSCRSLVANLDALDEQMERITNEEDFFFWLQAAFNSGVSAIFHLVFTTIFYVHLIWVAGRLKKPNFSFG